MCMQTHACVCAFVYVFAYVFNRKLSSLQRSCEQFHGEKKEKKSIPVGKDVADDFISKHKGTPVTATQSG